MQVNSNFKRIIANLIPIDIVTLGYVGVTLIYVVVSMGKLNDVWLHIILRVFTIGLICWMALVSQNIRNRLALFIRNVYPLILLSFFYAESDYLNNVLFNNLDPLFERIELMIFGVHPSVVFYEQFPQAWFSELMNLGYFSYYFLILLLPLWLWLKKSDSFQDVVFSITTSFYLFYLFFIIFPVAGPQFYLGESLRTIPDSGLFRWLVKFAEWLGEGQTGAFPSSHVGAVVIMSCLSFKHAKKLFPIYLVLGLLICFSTVYIKAHYAIDVVGGFVFGVLFFWVSRRLYRVLSIIKF